MKASLFSTIMLGAITSFAQPQFPLSLQQEINAWVNGAVIPAYTGGVTWFDWPWHPALADIDHDADFDLFVGTYDGRITFFENVGDSITPVFQFVTAFYAAIDEGSAAAPAFWDIDNDGDPDLFVGSGPDGNAGGFVAFYRNQGNAQVASFVLEDDQVSNLNTGDHAVPTLGDVDGDGDADLITGGGFGDLRIVVNLGDSLVPVWADQVLMGIDVGWKATPHLGDFNCDGKPDLIIGNDTGKLHFRKNLGKNANGVVLWSLPVTTTFTGVDFTYLDYTSPACADLDDDGDLDILLSEQFGNLNFFRNIGDACNYNWKWVTGDLLSGTIDVGESAFPGLVDIDADCDLDLFIGKANGQIRFYRNTGTPAETHWMLETEFFLGFDAGSSPARLTFNDFNFDGDFDLVITTGSYSWFYENIGNAFDYNFHLVAGNFSSGISNTNQIPLLADFNGDGFTDIAALQFNTPASYSIAIFHNTGLLGSPWPAQASETIFISNSGVGFFNVLDYDYDGDPDLVFVKTSGNDAIMLLRNNSSSWAIETLMDNAPWTNINSLAWADLDQDYDWDAFAGTQNGGVLFYRNTGNWAQADYSWTANLLSVQFADSSFHANEWQWAFGDGAFSSEQNPLHSYTAPGVYQVCLTTKNGCKSLSICHLVSTCSPPLANFDTTANLLTVQFTDASLLAGSWYWDFGDSTVSSEQNPLHVYSAPGKYEVCLRVENDCGVHDTCYYVFVCIPPLPAFDFSVQNFTDVVFTNGTVWADSYSWNFGDGQTSSEASPSHEYATDNTYLVTLTANNACGAVTVETLLTIVTLPVASFSADSTQGCVPHSVQFFNQSSANATSFQWTFPGGNPNSSNEANPVVIYQAPGNYPVTLVVGNAAGSQVLTQTGFVAINDSPKAGFTAIVNGNIATFNNISSNASGYFWNFGDGETSTETAPGHVYTADGTYLVSLTATNGCGSTTWEETVVIATPPVAGFSATPTNGCPQLTVQFSNQSSSNAMNFYWQFPGGVPAFSNEPQPVVTYGSAGLYDVYLTVSNPQGSDTLVSAGLIEVLAFASGDFNFLIDGQTVTFKSKGVNADSLTWDFGDGQFSKEADPVHVYQLPGPYNVMMTAYNGCSAFIISKTIVLDFVGVNEADSALIFQIFPNPGEGRFTLILKGKSYPQVEIDIFDALGQRVISQTNVFGQGWLIEDFDLGEAPAGTYWVVVRTGKMVQIGKVVKR